MLERLVVVLVAFGVLGLVAGGAVLYALHWRKTVGPQIWARFLDRTGYRLAASPDLDLTEQARKVMEGFGPGGATRGPWVRRYGPLAITYRSKIEGDGDAIRTSESWTGRLSQGARIPLQIVDRSIAEPTMLARLGSAAAGLSRSFIQRFPPVHIPDPAFAQRFLAFSPVPDQALDLLGSDWELRMALFNLPEVDLLVEGDAIGFEDPSGKLRAKFVGAAVNPSRLVDLEPRMHDAVAWVMARVAERVV